MYPARFVSALPLVFSVGATQDKVTLSLDPTPVPDEPPLEEVLDVTPLEELLEEVLDVTPLEEVLDVTPLDELLEDVLDVTPLEELVEEVLDVTPLEELLDEVFDITPSVELSDALPLEEPPPPQPESSAAIKDAATIFHSNPPCRLDPIAVLLAIAFQVVPQKASGGQASWRRAG